MWLQSLRCLCIYIHITYIHIYIYYIYYICGLIKKKITALFNFSAIFKHFFTYQCIFIILYIYVYVYIHEKFYWINSLENRSLFFNKAADVKPRILFKKRPRHSCFPVNFEKSLEIHHWRYLVVVSHNYSFFPQNFEILTLKSALLFLRDLLSKIILLLLNIF